LLTLCRYSIVTDIPLVLIGIAGIFAAYRLHHILYHQHARMFLWAAIVVGGIAIGLDLFGGASVFMTYEEGFEVLAEALFIGMLLGWRNPRAKTNDRNLPD
jgi:hypothetical protein